jgi:hypothetical protein
MVHIHIRKFLLLLAGWLAPCCLLALACPCACVLCCCAACGC